MLGSWSYQSYLTPYDSFIFYNAIGNHRDYFYTPIAVAKQIVNGTNYRFICIARPLMTQLVVVHYNHKTIVVGFRFIPILLLNC